MVQFSTKDLDKIMGYMLYDLLALGYLNEKGQAIFSKGDVVIPADIVEQWSHLNTCLQEKQEDGFVL